MSIFKAETQPGPLTPDRLGCFPDVTVGGEEEKPLERPREPAVMHDGEHRALVGLQALLQRLGAGQVEIVGRLVEQEQGGAGPASSRICSACNWSNGTPVSSDSSVELAGSAPSGGPLGRCPGAGTLPDPLSQPR